MGVKVYLRPVSADMTSLTLLGYKTDFSFRISFSCVDIGHVHISRMEDENLFIEWIELFPAYRGKGYLRQVFLTVMDHFKKDMLIFESSEAHKDTYTHIGAVVRNYDSFREMTEFKLHRDRLKTKM